MAALIHDMLGTFLESGRDNAIPSSSVVWNPTSDHVHWRKCQTVLKKAEVQNWWLWMLQGTLVCLRSSISRWQIFTPQETHYPQPSPCILFLVQWYFPIHLKKLCFFSPRLDQFLLNASAAESTEALNLDKCFLSVNLFRFSESEAWSCSWRLGLREVMWICGSTCS